MATTPNLRLLGILMVLVGLATTICLPIMARHISVMTETLALIMRGQFLGAAAMTLGGAWLQWFSRNARVPGAFPVLQG